MLIKGKTILRDTFTFPIGTEDLRKEKMQESFAECVCVLAILDSNYISVGNWH